jgi:hypothetical protein
VQDAGDGCSASCQCEQHPCNFAVDASVHLSSVVSRLAAGATLTLAGRRYSREGSCGWSINAGNGWDASPITIRNGGDGRAVVDCDNAGTVVEQLGNGFTGGNLRLVGIHFTNAIRMGGSGAVLKAEYASRVVIEDCLVSNSSASGEGGAVCVGGGSTLDIVGSHFEECNADHGGAIAIVDGSQASISNSKFLSCFAADGGAIFVSRSSTLQLEGSRLSENHAANHGGALAASVLSAVNVSDSVFERCISDWMGGAIGVLPWTRLRLSGRSTKAHGYLIF